MPRPTLSALRTRLRTRLRAWNHARLQRLRAARAERSGEGADYARWVRLYDTIDDDLRACLHIRARALRTRPLISVLMPVHNPDPAWLDAAIASVRAQVYSEWELCMADDRSTDPRVQQVLARHAASDPRIRIVWRLHNGHISAASNSALEMAGGDYVALLDHDDRLPEHALLCVAETIARFPDAAVLYSDEDKLDAEGRRCAPYFKCDFNLELFRSQNLVSHLGVYRADLVRAVGGFRMGFEGSQDYDLALRCIETVGPARVVHIPHVLYHWRMHAESTASSGAAKPYAHLAGRRALEEHFARSGLDCRVESEPAGWYRCEYRLPAPAPTVLVVVADSAGRRQLRRCLEALRRGTVYPAFEIVVASARKGTTLPDACNRLIAENPAQVVALIDVRCRFASADWLQRLVARACLPDVGGVGAKLLSPRGRIVGNGLLLGVGALHAVPLGLGTSARRGGQHGRARLAQQVGALGRGCVVARSAHIRRAGWLDPTFRDLGAALVDLTFRFGAYGLLNHWAPEVHAVLGSQRWREQRIARREAQRVAERWGFAHLRDAGYNDNLGLASGRFQLAHPPRVSPAQPWFVVLDS